MIAECEKYDELDSYTKYLKKAYDKFHKVVEGMTDSKGYVAVTAQNALKLALAWDSTNEKLALQELTKLRDNTFGHLDS